MQTRHHATLRRPLGLLVALIVGIVGTTDLQAQQSGESAEQAPRRSEAEPSAASSAGLPPAWSDLHRAFFELSRNAPQTAAETLRDMRKRYPESPAAHLACPVLERLARRDDVSDSGCRLPDPPNARNTRFVVQNPDWVTYQDAFEALASERTDRAARLLAGLRDRRDRHPTTPLAEELLGLLNRRDAEPPPLPEETPADKQEEFAGPVGDPDPLPSRKEARPEESEREVAETEDEAADKEESERADASDSVEDDLDPDLAPEPTSSEEQDSFAASRPDVGTRIVLEAIGAFVGALAGASTNALIGAGLGELFGTGLDAAIGAAIGATAGGALTPPIGAFIVGENLQGNGKLWGAYLGFVLGSGVAVLLGAAISGLGPLPSIIGGVTAFLAPWVGAGAGYEISDPGHPKRKPPE